MIWMLAGLALAQDAPEEPSAPEPEPAADTSMAEAKRLYENGQRLYEEALYDEAILAFEESYALSKQPALLFNIANAQERMGDLAGAVKSLNKYRVNADAEEQTKLERRVSILEDRIEKEATAKPDPVPVPVPTPQPVLPEVQEVNNPTKWGTLGAGIGATVVFGSLTAWSYTQGRAAVDAGDQAAYGGPRAINNASIALTVVGLGLTGVGLALPAKKPAPAVGLSITPDDARVTASMRF